MSSIRTVDGDLKEAFGENQWLFLHSASQGLIMAQEMSSSEVCSSRQIMKVFDLESEMIAEVRNSGYVMPTEEEV